MKIRALGWALGAIAVIPVLVVFADFYLSPPPVSEKARIECESIPEQVYHTGGRLAGTCFPNEKASIEAERNQ